MTLTELANTLGLSPTTVSRALNGSPEVRDAPRQRVQRVTKAARAHDNLPNARARGPVCGRGISVASHDDALSCPRNGAEKPIFTATRSSMRAPSIHVGSARIARSAACKGRRL